VKKKILWLVVLLLLFISSYYREVLFRSINGLIGGEAFFYAKTMELPLFSSWSIPELLRLKYLLTLAFSMVFILLSLLGLKVSFQDNTPFYIALAIYSLLVLFSLLLGLIGITLLNFETVYPLLRKVIGFIHSPLLYLLVSVSFIGVQSFADTIKKNE
jgi:hypothetical protein